MRPVWLGRSALRAVVAGVVLLLLLWVRCAAEARREWVLAARYEVAGDLEGRIDALGRAVRWTAPLNLYASDALTALLSEARRQERRGDREAALRTFRTARGSLVASAGVVQLRGDQLAEADAAIQRLRPAVAASDGARPLLPHPSARRAAQHVPWSRTLALLGFALWVGAAFALAQLGPRDASRPRLLYRALVGVGLACFGAGLWLS